jgi:hypothetical protein
MISRLHMGEEEKGKSLYMMSSVFATEKYHVG